MAARANQTVLVRSAIAGDSEWNIPNPDGDVTGMAVKHYLVTYGGVSCLDKLVLLAGTRPVSDTERVRPVLAATAAEGHLTVVRSSPSWLSDKRVALAGKWMKAVFDGTLSPGGSNFDTKWRSAAAPAVSPETLDSLVRRVLGKRAVVLAQWPSIEEFLLLLGSELQLFEQWVVFDVLMVGGPGGYRVPELQPFPEFVTRCAIDWGLAFSTPGDANATWPLVLPQGNLFGKTFGLTMLKPPECCLDEETLRSRLKVISSHDILPDLGCIDKALFIGRSFDPPSGVILDTRTALVALRIRARVAARLPVVLLGDFREREDSEVCKLAQHLLFCPGQAPGLQEHEVEEGLPEDLVLVPDEDEDAPLVPGERPACLAPLSLLRARGETPEDVSRLALFAEAAGGWIPKTVWSVSTAGTMRDQVLAMLPRELGAAALIDL